MYSVYTGDPSHHRHAILILVYNRVPAPAGNLLNLCKVVESPQTNWRSQENY